MTPVSLDPPSAYERAGPQRLRSLTGGPAIHCLCPIRPVSLLIYRRSNHGEEFENGHRRDASYSADPHPAAYALHCDKHWRVRVATVKRIDHIEIQNIKGILHRPLKVTIWPNRPTILVAPNGFGKSSIAAAFASLRKNRLELSKDYLHKGDETLSPLLRITFAEPAIPVVTKYADSTTNDISSVFDVAVLNSQLVSKAKVLKINGASIPQSAIEVEPITLVAKIPAKVKLQYAAASVRAQFGANGKLLPNLTQVFSRPRLLAELGRSVDFSKAAQVGQQAPLQALRNRINSLAGTSAQISAAIPTSEIQAVLAVRHVEQIVTAMKKCVDPLGSDLDYCLGAIQVHDLWAASKAAFRAAMEYAQYEEDLAAYQNLFQTMRTTWRNIRPEEVKGALVVRFPRANQISNGERDVLSFIGQLLRARVQLRKENCILVVDELFDYLDDANLVACQYYLSNMLGDFKAEGRQLFALIMTHLDPGYFKTFVFAKQHIEYLQRATVPTRVVEKVIAKRGHPSIKDEISRAYLHHHPTPATLVAEFVALGLDASLDDSTKFAAHVVAELQKYKADAPCDPIAVCCAIRLRIEQKIFAQLDAANQNDFLNTFTTNAKLDFAQNLGIPVPEVFYFLGVIYNAALHIWENLDNFSPLASKLENRTIRQMILSAV
jgi:hypothetical protein